MTTHIRTLGTLLLAGGALLLLHRHPSGVAGFIGRSGLFLVLVGWQWPAPPWPGRALAGMGVMVGVALGGAALLTDWMPATAGNAIADWRYLALFPLLLVSAGFWYHLWSRARP